VLTLPSRCLPFKIRNLKLRSHGERPTGFAIRSERRRGKNLLWSQNKMSRNYRGRCSIAAPRPFILCAPLLRITFRKIWHGAKSAAKNHREDRKTGPFMSTNASERRERAFPPAAIINIPYRPARDAEEAPAVS